MNWLCFITSLPTENATVRQRAWRSLKSSGAAVLRDGVYLLPASAEQRTFLAAQAQDVLASGGSAWVLETREPEGTDFASLFNRSEEYAALLAEVSAAAHRLDPASAPDVVKQVRKLRKAFDQLQQIDFFPGSPRQQVETALIELEIDCARLLSPNEPHAASGAIRDLRVADYQGRTWATRCRPWVDRLATAWLIRRFIDPQARIVWLKQPQDCPRGALGFDFDGADFSHVGSRVTFEVVAASFGLTQAALTRLGLLVHYLDVGGVQLAEAQGVEATLAGLRETLSDDDRLLASACAVFDGLYASFGNSINGQEPQA
ncbi:MAG: hypothetical protein RJA36_131 [Pseudomonadota bacterium]|jgi:hypothetical protein